MGRRGEEGGEGGARTREEGGRERDRERESKKINNQSLYDSVGSMMRE